MRKGIATVGISLFLHLFGRGEAKKRRWYYTWEQKRSTDRFLTNNWTLIAVKKARIISIKQLSFSPFIGWNKKWTRMIKFCFIVAMKHLQKVTMARGELIKCNADYYFEQQWKHLTHGLAKCEILARCQVFEMRITLSLVFQNLLTFLSSY